MGSSREKIGILQHWIRSFGNDNNRDMIGRFRQSNIPRGPQWNLCLPFMFLLMIMFSDVHTPCFWAALGATGSKWLRKELLRYLAFI